MPSIQFFDTGRSFSEALILASTNQQYDKRLFIDLPVQYTKTKGQFISKANFEVFI